MSMEPRRQMDDTRWHKLCVPAQDRIDEYREKWQELIRRNWMPTEYKYGDAYTDGVSVRFDISTKSHPDQWALVDALETTNESQIKERKANKL
ncbi:MAG: hypothetical protein GY749_22665 [Desulfobacteraceae bacterium]|nr:hypothetical protein [Desulfobacteraceae bacterium]